jgi:hypothetical protein
MTVGGWFDAEDLYGPLNTYNYDWKVVKSTILIVVMGPWVTEIGLVILLNKLLRNINFGDSISGFIKKNGS